MTEQTVRSAEAEANDAPKPRRWLDLWPMLIPVLLIGGLLWVSFWFMRRAEMFEDSGHVEFDAPAWAWVEAIGGPETRTLIGSPTSFHASGERLSRSELRMISGFTELTDFACTGMTDDDLSYLAGLSKLESLRLERSSFTDAGCAVLAHFPELTYLSITTDQRLTAEGLAYMGELSQLTNLWIDAPGLTDADLAPLSRLSLLESLTLTNADLQGDGLKHIWGLPALQGLGLVQCRISPTALSHLAGTHSALRLELRGSTITDEHLSSLAAVNGLLWIGFWDTEVTREGCEAFATAHPRILVYGADGQIVTSAPAMPKGNPE